MLIIMICLKKKIYHQILLFWFVLNFHQKQKNVINLTYSSHDFWLTWARRSELIRLFKYISWFCFTTASQNDIKCFKHRVSVFNHNFAFMSHMLFQMAASQRGILIKLTWHVKYWNWMNIERIIYLYFKDSTTALL